jgi:hypothetical protein
MVGMPKKNAPKSPYLPPNVVEFAIPGDTLSARDRLIGLRQTIAWLESDLIRETDKRGRKDIVEKIEHYKVELAALVADNVEIPRISREIDEGILNDALATILTAWGIPESMHRETAAKLERIAKADAKAALRPKWDERGKYSELKDLSAPQFLKHVFADEIAPDGSIKKETVRESDPKLMSIVEAYISARERDGRDLGAAKGLRFITSNAGRPKRADLG